MRTLKKFIYWLPIIAFWLIASNFVNAEVYNWYSEIELQQYEQGTVNLDNETQTITINVQKNKTYCVYLSFTPSGTSNLFQFTRNPGAFSTSSYKTYTIAGDDGVSTLFMCGDSPNSSNSNMTLYFEKKSPPSNFVINYTIYTVNAGSGQNNCQCETCPTIDQNYCESNNLCQTCPTIDQNYCESNNLCQSYNCPTNTGDLQRSALYINNIQHIGAPTIKIDIPEEIEREYENTEQEMNIDIEWYWYDQEKMQSIVNMQNYKPTNTEMSELIGKIADFLPLLAVALLIIRARRIIKKVF